MDLRVEPSPAGGYVVRMTGHDVPVSRHDTEEEAQAWVARFGGGPPAPAAAAPAARFAALPDGTQVIVRPPVEGEGPGTLVAVDPKTGAIAGRLVDGTPQVDDAWAGKGVDATLGDPGPALPPVEGKRRGGAYD